MSNQTFIVVARRVRPGWYQVVKDFTPPNGEIDYPYMHAANADAEARASASIADFCAFVLRSEIRVGREFNLLTERADPIDRSVLQIAKRGIVQ